MNRKEEIYLQGRCPCSECSGTKLDEKLVNWILNFEKKTRLKIEITSGARCKSYNQQVGGYWNSPHIIDENKIGHAIDFYIMGFKSIKTAYKVDGTGLKRIGIYRSHVHGDFVKPNPSKYWYAPSGNPIYSGHINDLTEFLLFMKKEGRLSYDELDTLNHIVRTDNPVVSNQKKDGILQSLFWWKK